jgi:hypothetical protein
MFGAQRDVLPVIDHDQMYLAYVDVGRLDGGRTERNGNDVGIGRSRKPHVDGGWCARRRSVRRVRGRGGGDEAHARADRRA